MNNIFDALEICLNELENGADIETVLARYPNLAAELRPILETSQKARNMSIAEPSVDAVRRGRARVMQHAAEIREVTAVPRTKRVIPAFQRLALSFTLAALLLLSSTGLLNASASALPGESLYPVKRTWEGLRLFLIFNTEARNLLESQYKSERLQEVNELLIEGRHETIQFAGVFMQVNGLTYVSGIPVILPADISSILISGTAVIVTGRTNAQGVVEIISIESLPDGSVVPVGNPVIVESESGDSGTNTNSSPGILGTEPESKAQYYEIEGTLQSISVTTLVINGMTVYSSDAQIKGDLCTGLSVEIKGYFDKDGKFIATEVEGKGSCAGSNGQGGDDTNSNGDNNLNSNLNSNDDDSNDSSGSDDSNDSSDDNSNDTNDSSDD